MRTADVLVGRWEPVKTDVPDKLFLQFWDTAETFVIGSSAMVPTNRIYVRCHVSGPCGALTLPAGLPTALLVEPVGS